MAAAVLALCACLTDLVVLSACRTALGKELRGGLAPAAALRSAQTSMSRDARWTLPAHWAGFIIQGDWRPAISEK